MKEMQFVVEINATKEIVWNTLWQDETFRQWAGIIDTGTYMVGDLVQGNEVQYISAENGYGVTSLVEKVIPSEYLLLKHQSDTQDMGARERDKEWTGGEEVYSLLEKDGVTTLSVKFDVPTDLENYFKVKYPEAFNRVKEMAESKK